MIQNCKKSTFINTNSRRFRDPLNLDLVKSRSISKQRSAHPCLKKTTSQFDPKMRNAILLKKRRIQFLAGHKHALISRLTCKKDLPIEDKRLQMLKSIELALHRSKPSKQIMVEQKLKALKKEILGVNQAILTAKSSIKKVAKTSFYFEIFKTNLVELFQARQHYISLYKDISLELDPVPKFTFFEDSRKSSKGEKNEKFGDSGCGNGPQTAQDIPQINQEGQNALPKLRLFEKVSECKSTTKASTCYESSQSTTRFKNTTNLSSVDEEDSIDIMIEEEPTRPIAAKNGVSGCQEDLQDAEIGAGGDFEQQESEEIGMELEQPETAQTGFKASPEEGETNGDSLEGENNAEGDFED